MSMFLAPFKCSFLNSFAVRTSMMMSSLFSSRAVAASVMEMSRRVEPVLGSAQVVMLVKRKMVRKNVFICSLKCGLKEGRVM